MMTNFCRHRTIAPALLACIVTWSGLLPASVAAADTASDERAAIAAERNAAQARFVERDRACRQRFVVSSCLADARRDRRTALDALQVRQRVIDDARRRDRAESRRAALADKLAEDGKRDREAASKGRSASAADGSAASAARVGRPFETPREGRTGRVREAPAAASPRAPRAAASSSKAARAVESAGQRQAREERSRKAFATRQQEAAKHRDEALGNAILRMEKLQPAQSLPTPATPPARAASAP